MVGRTRLFHGCPIAPPEIAVGHRRPAEPRAGAAPAKPVNGSRPRTLLLGLGAVVAAFAAGAGFLWHQWRERAQAAVVAASVPPVPDLASWPPEYASRVRAATAAARRFEQPVAALGELAALYHANDCYRQADQVERGLLALEPRNARWAYALADTCGKLGDMDGQRAYLERALQLAPYYPNVRIKLAELLLKLGALDEARAHYEWRLTLAPSDPYGRLGLARIALQRGDRTTALKYLEAIARDNPDFPSAHNLLAEVYANMGDAARAAEQRKLSGGTGEWREAEDPWLAAVYAFSFDAYRLEILGGGRQQARQLQASLPFYQEAVRLAPRDGLAYDALGNLYLQLNELDRAAAALEAGLAAAPRTAVLYATLARVRRSQGNASLAVAVLQKGIAELPAAPELRFDLGARLEEGNRRDDAVAAYREAVRLNPDYPEARWNLGVCLLAAGDAAGARENLGRALALRPRNGDALTALIKKAIEGGHLDQAASCLHALVESGPGVPARELIGQALAAARRTGDAKAIQDFEQLLTQAPR